VSQAFSKDIQNALTALSALSKTAGVRASSDMPEDQVSVFPTALWWLMSSREQPYAAAASRQVKRLITLHGEIHYPLRDLGRAVAELMPYADDVPAAIWQNRTLNGTITDIVEIRVAMATSLWNEIQTLALSFDVDVVMHASR
jgi:hypothetical protein